MRPRPEESAWRGLFDAAALFLATTVFALLAAQVWDPRESRTDLLAHLTAQHVLVIIGLTLVLARQAGLPLAALAGRTRSPALWLTAAGAGAGAVVILQSPLVEAWADRLGYEPPAWWDLAVVVSPPAQAVVTGLLLGLVPALSEELFFRGLLLRRLKGLGAPAAVLLQAGVFAAYHLDLFALPIYFASGVLLGALRLWSGALWPCVLAHLGNNLFGIVEIAADITAWERLGGLALPLGLGLGVLAVLAGRRALRSEQRRDEGVAHPGQ